MATRPDGLAARGLPQEEIVARVRALAAGLGAGEEELEAGSFRDQSWVRVPARVSPALFVAMRDDAALAFDMAMDVTAVQFPRRPLPLGEFDVVVHLVSLSKGHRMRFKVACPDPEAGVPSLTPVWPGANFMEREAYDMFGVRFTGHPDLRRILMPPEFEGFPMRKDFSYRGY